MKEKWDIICWYKDFLIYKKKGILYFSNRKFSSSRAISVRSAKIRITKYIKTLSNRERKNLKNLRHRLEY